MTDIDLSVLNGRNGFTIQGVSQDGLLGDAVSDGGDINGDGLADILIGAENADVDGDNNQGQVSVIFGSNDGFSDRIRVDELDGNNGFVIDGVREEQRFGTSVSFAGDVNGDDISDIVIGANNTNSGRGDSYIIFGRSSFDESVDLTNLDGSNGFKVDGITESDRFGTVVSEAGDLNDDGIDDILITATSVDVNGNEDAGAAYVIFGNEAGFPDDLDLTTIDGTNGFILNGIGVDDSTGVSASGGEDFNGDGIDDLLVSSPGVNPEGRENAGRTYVVFGRDSEFPDELDLANLNGFNGFDINGIVADDASGVSVSAAGDVNNDGIADIGIGAPFADGSNENAGQSYIVYGSETVVSEGSFSLNDLDGSNGFVINGAEVDDQLGTSISAAGDVNNDDIDDFIVGAVGAEEEAGTSYVVFGSDEFEGTLNLSDLNINRGFAIDGIVGGDGTTPGDRSGEAVSGAGDVNNDGIDDLLVGAPQASPVIDDDNSQIRDAGEAYVVYGRVENLGDVNNDNAYTNEDAYLISRVAVGLDSAFEAYSGIDPLLVADVNSDGVVSALDSAIVYSAANDGTSNFILPDLEG